MSDSMGGGAAKVLYTLRTLRKIGATRSAKALTSHNACKACALGMGGQQGGMTDELGEFPSVCNKSIQAQSTDIQPPIPEQIFDHSIAELDELSAKDLEHLGRLTVPLLKRAGEDSFSVIDWGAALDIVQRRLTAVSPQRAFFYASGRSSNEAGFLLQLLARCWGTNNVTNCSFYCHQATSVGLGASIGTGTATIELDDLTGCDTIFVIGANPASNHPRFIYKLMECRQRGGSVVVINPARECGLERFAAPKKARSLLLGGTEVASYYVQPRIGGDMALLKGLAKAILDLGAEDIAFIKQFTTNWSSFKADIDALTWREIELASGVARQQIEQVAAVYAKSRHAVFAWGMGITHQLNGSENVECIANLALLRGMVGQRFAGLLPLRGHSNVQGIGTIGVKPVLAQEVLERMESELGVAPPKTPGLDTLASLEAAHDGAIDAALMLGGNLYAATPSSDWAAQALGQIGFKVFLTTTLNRGHLRGHGDGDSLILPVLARDEEPQATTQESMFNYVRLSDGGIDRLHGPRSEVSILSELGRRLLPEAAVDFAAFSDHQTVRETIAAVVPGMADLKSIGIAKREFHVRGRLLHAPTFKTADGKARFNVHRLPCQNQANKQFPLTLATVRSEGQFNSIIYEETDSYRGDAKRRSVLMNQEDMLEHGLVSGQRVRVSSSLGVMEQMEVRAFDVARGSCLAYYPEANVLVGRDRDPRSKTPAFKNIAVRVTPA